MDHTRKDTIEKHVASFRHKSSVEDRANAVLSSSTLFDFGIAATKVPIGLGASLSLDHKKFRMAVLRVFLTAGVPIAKTDDFRELLELYSPYSLTDSSQMAKNIPLVLKEMNAKTRSLIKDRFVVILFDGTPHNILVRSSQSSFDSGMVDSANAYFNSSILISPLQP